MVNFFNTAVLNKKMVKHDDDNYHPYFLLPDFLRDKDIFLKKDILDTIKIKLSLMIYIH